MEAERGGKAASRAAVLRPRKEKPRRNSVFFPRAQGFASAPYAEAYFLGAMSFERGRALLFRGEGDVRCHAHAIGTFLKYLDGGVSRSVLDAADFSPGNAGARGQFLLGEISGWAGSHQRSHDFHFRLEIGTGLGEFGILRAFLEEIARGSSGVLGVR